MATPPPAELIVATFVTTLAYLNIGYSYYTYFKILKDLDDQRAILYYTFTTVALVYLMIYGIYSLISGYPVYGTVFLIPLNILYFCFTIYLTMILNRVKDSSVKKNLTIHLAFDSVFSIVLIFLSFYLFYTNVSCKCESKGYYY